MVRLQKLYSKFKAIESGRAVTEVTKGSYCSRTRIVGVSKRPLEHRSLCSTWSQAFFGWTSPSCASTQGEGGPSAAANWACSSADDGFHAIPARVGEGRQRRCLGNVLQANNCVPDLLSRSWQVFLR